MNHQAKQFDWLRLLRLLFGAFVVLYVLSRLLPCVSPDEYPVTDSLENSWTQALHVAFLNHFQFGTEFVFTYGPWGFLARGYHLGTFFTAVVSWSALSLIFLVAAWRVARSVSSQYFLQVIWLVLFTAAMTIPAGEDINTRLVGFGVLLLLLHFFVEDRAITWIQALLAISLGWMSLIKFTGFAEGVVVVSVIALDVIFRFRRFPWIIAYWLGGLISFWCLAGQSIGLLPTFLKRSWQVTSGYTEAMMLTDSGELWRIGAFGALALLLCGMMFKPARVRLNIFGWLPLLGFAAILFIVFKLGYVRSGWQHECTAALALLLMVIAGFALKWSAETQSVRVAFFGLFIAATIFAGFVFGRWFPGDGLTVQMARTFQPSNMFAPVAVLTTDYLKTKYEQRLAQDRKTFPLSPISGTVDLYSYDQSALFAHGLNYRPRPVIQSYSAYTPELAEINAAHLRGASAASNILFAIQPIDGRLPAFDDSLSWLELLAHYRLAGTNAGFLHLTRIAAPQTFRLVQIEEVTASTDGKFLVPSSGSGLIWVTIELRQSLAGRMLLTLYKPSILKIFVILEDDSQMEFRFVPGMARAGFLLSPCVVETGDFTALLKMKDGTALAGKRVKSIAVLPKKSSVGYENAFTLRFYSLEF